MLARRILHVVGLVILMTLSSFSNPRTQRVETGTWGGRHIRMEVAEGSASVEFDCANGSITVPLILNRKGEFSWRGVYSRERGGPVQIDKQPKREPALYTGSLSGHTMTMRIKLTDSDEDLGTFISKQGSAGKVFKCL